MNAEDRLVHILSAIGVLYNSELLDIEASVDLRMIFLLFNTIIFLKKCSLKQLKPQ